MRDNLVGRIEFGPFTSMSELQRFTVTAPAESAHAIDNLRKRVAALEKALEAAPAMILTTKEYEDWYVNYCYPAFYVTPPVTSTDADLSDPDKAGKPSKQAGSEPV